MTSEFVPLADRLGSSFKDAEKLYLLSVSIGPVQEFIAEARKTRDLWIGSFMLSAATFKAMIPILDIYGPTAIVLPYIEESEFYKEYRLGQNPISAKTYGKKRPSSSLPNHFIAVVPEDKLQNLTNEIKDKVHNYLLSLGREILPQLSSLDSVDLNSLWEFQLKHVFEPVWVAIPVTLDELRESYKTKYEEIERFLEERKITRTFESWRGSTAVKCVQCGRREVIGPPEFGQSRKFWDDLRSQRSSRGRIKKNERLCAVCLTKRLILENQLLSGMSIVPFDSTSDLAVKPFRDHLVRNKAEPAAADLLEHYIKLAGLLAESPIKNFQDIPGGWFYFDELDAESLTEESIPSDVNALINEVEETKKSLKKVIDILGISPSKYYTILTLDADKMGEYISGKRIPDDTAFSIEWQREQARLLSEIVAEDYPPVVEQWGGMIVYSAGDDFLAIGPLEGATKTISELREKFSRKIGTTMSGSLIIAHHNDSFRWAVEESRRALQMAKDDFGRDSLVITLRLSSGTSVSCGSRWRLDLAGRKVALIDDVAGNLLGWLKLEEAGLGMGFIFDLMSEMPTFYYWDAYRKRFLLPEPDFFRTEFNRLLKRHLPKTSPIWDDKASIANIIDFLVEIGNPERMEFLAFDRKTNLESLLKIITFLAREE
ncbi:MAG: type III-B CRISPR-associated protein Cas10/Cmr2 [Archaeoglobales archaeon]|nr:type III-B CRISPR-associated protein Cas10/Cmr2 [Archaeoglobales archaeon]